MQQLGEQIIDLEAMANHKGSVFGHLGQSPQPTNEQFENELYKQWVGFDPQRPVWLEDESRMIGRITLPDPVIRRISDAPMVRIQLDLSIRIHNLVGEYAQYELTFLEEAIRKISQRIGGERTTQAIHALRSGDFQTVASIALAYYDKAYEFAMERRSCRTIRIVPVTGKDPGDDANRVLTACKDLFDHGCHLS